MAEQSLDLQRAARDPQRANDRPWTEILEFWPLWEEKKRCKRSKIKSSEETYLLGRVLAHSPVENLASAVVPVKVRRETGAEVAPPGQGGAEHREEHELLDLFEWPGEGKRQGGLASD